MGFSFLKGLEGGACHRMCQQMDLQDWPLIWPTTPSMVLRVEVRSYQNELSLPIAARNDCPKIDKGPRLSFSHMLYSKGPQSPGRSLVPCCLPVAWAEPSPFPAHRWSATPERLGTAALQYYSENGGGGGMLGC